MTKKVKGLLLQLIQNPENLLFYRFCRAVVIVDHDGETKLFAILGLVTGVVEDIDDAAAFHVHIIVNGQAFVEIVVPGLGYCGLQYGGHGSGRDTVGGG